MNQRQRDIRLANQPFFHTALCTQPEHLVASVLQRTGGSQRGEYVATGATSHHQKTTGLTHTQHLPPPFSWFVPNSFAPYQAVQFQPLPARRCQCNSTTGFGRLNSPGATTGPWSEKTPSSRPLWYPPADPSAG